MIPAENSPIYDMLAAWEQARRAGRDIPPEELCRDRPDLLNVLKDAIESLRATAWMDRPLGHGAAVPDEAADAVCVVPGNLGEYTLLEHIGSGGQGHVFKALHRRLERVVAVKVLPTDLAGTPEASERFNREVRAAGKLSHPNVVAAYDAGEQGGVPYLAMELVQGVTLDRLVQEQGPLPVGLAVEYILQAAAGLHYSHSRGVSHHDIKPANLIIAEDGTVKVLDFGLASFRRPAGAGSPLPPAGSLNFLAPEQADPAGQVDHRADIFSLGATLFYLLTGKPPFPGETTLAKLAAVRNAPVPSLREARPDVPSALDAAIQKMVAKRPEDRYQSMAEVIAALKAVQPASGARRWKGLLASGILAGLIVVAVAAWSSWWPARQVPVAAPVVTTSTEERRFDNNTDDIRAVAVSPDGRCVLSGSFNTNVVRLWDVQTGKLTRSFAGHTKKIHGVAFSRDGNLTASGGGDDDSTIRIWNVGDGELVRVIEGHEGGVWSVAFDPEGTQVYSASDDRTIRMWSIETGQEVRRFTGHVGGVFRLAVSKDGQHLLSDGSDNRVFWWNVATGEPIYEFRGHATAVWALAISPDGKLGLSGDQAGIIRLLDLTTGKELDKWLSPTEAVFALAFHPSGKLALSGGGGGWRRRHDEAPMSPADRLVYAKAENNSISLWSVPDGRLLHHFNGHSDSVWGLAFGPKGDWFVSGSRDRTIRRWLVPPGPAQRPVGVESLPGRVGETSGRQHHWKRGLSACVSGAAAGPVHP